MFNIKLSKKQEEKLKKFKEKCNVEYTGAIGGQYTYMFTPTNLGLIFKVEDCVSNKVIDLTEYEDW